jgi:hypothetical protein
MISVYVDGEPLPLTAYLQVVVESLLDVVHSLVCPAKNRLARCSSCVRPQLHPPVLTTSCGVACHNFTRTG